MAFLDNSGDIILDAVLTDTGRLRLARGDGSFKITKFAFGDDEVNYGLYDKNNTSGSAYYDLDILQMPVFEAFTNNTSVLKYPLLSISKTNLLYLPVLLLNTGSGDNTSTDTTGGRPGGNPLIDGSYVIASDTTTTSAGYIYNSNQLDGVSLKDSLRIKIDQGINSNAIGLVLGDSGDQLTSYGLNETQYMIMIDNRLGTLISGDKNQLNASFIDDDNVATYFVSQATDTATVVQILTSNDSENLQTNQAIEGPRGTTVLFLIKASTLLQTSTDLFTKLGAEVSIGTNTYYYIDTNVVVKGVTTGSSITVPVRFVKYKSTP